MTGFNARFRVYDISGKLTQNSVEDMRPVYETWQGTQVTASESHPEWRMTEAQWVAWQIRHLGYVSSNRSEDVGGDFTSRKSYFAGPPLVQQFVDSGYYSPGGGPLVRKTLNACIVPDAPSSMPFPPSAESSDSALMKAGTTAVARCAPDNSVAELAVGLSEFYREGIPHMLGSLVWKTRAKKARDVFRASGDEYLNAQFGWAPLISDISDVTKGVTKFQALLNQYLKDAGKLVRRRYEFPPIETRVYTITKPSASAKALALSDVNEWHDVFNQGKVERERYTFKRQWFSGAFTYHLPKDTGDGLVAHAEQAIRLFGLDLDPEVLWNLAPWSWAADWFASTGDVIHNVSSWSSDGLVMKYGYIMEHTIVRDTYRFMGRTGYKSAVYPQPVSLVTEVKLRRRATPFGFGVSWGSLSNRQKAIVAALGVSRV
uniref:Uncharacterized protein n=1 Tax=Leviviridae sp. TaxID=2027243 RepID=A0A514D7J9_9VIRU|nr:MAG: hypothetical protein H4BulkLitter24272_000003 [Leviviridae sp.]